MEKIKLPYTIVREVWKSLEKQGVLARKNLAGFFTMKDLLKKS